MVQQQNSSITSVLGSFYDNKKEGTYFSLFSSVANKVEVCLFDKNNNETRYALDKNEDDIWRIFISGIKSNSLYGYRVYCENQNLNGEVLLLDPYAKSISLKDGILLNVVIDEDYKWDDDQHPNIAWSDTIIYEAHVKGLTQLHPDIPENIRGSYAGLSHPVMLDYLKQLGITSVELLPVQYHLDECRLQKQGLTNYWGYNVVAPFSVDDKYWSKREGTTAISEFKDMVKALHHAGFEIILDVVFNHTAELDDNHPTLSLKGIDKQHYYWTDENGKLINWTGCGNSLKFMDKNTVQWVIDCLRYWYCNLHVDGFRFDLGAILGRTPEFSKNSPLLHAILSDSILNKAKLISEPWDIGENGYQLGNFPYPFAEWNDVYRDTMRQFWLHKNISLGKFAQHFSASSTIFQKDGRKPNSTINFITSHDGFTLNDLVSFNQKHNEQNGENNQDGHNQNWSHNFGYEGNHASEETQLERLNAQKNLLSTLLLSQGTPMLLAGDEWSNSQNGNNNVYCQDNPIGWLNWQDKNEVLLEHVKSIIKLRKQIRALTKNEWWRSDSDVSWFNHLGQNLSLNEEWDSTKFLVIQIRLSNDCLVIINATDKTVPVCFIDKQSACSLGNKLIVGFDKLIDDVKIYHNTKVQKNTILVFKT